MRLARAVLIATAYATSAAFRLPHNRAEYDGSAFSESVTCANRRPRAVFLETEAVIEPRGLQCPAEPDYFALMS